MRQWRFTWQELKDIFALFNSKKDNDLLNFTEKLMAKYEVTESEAEIIWSCFSVSKTYYMFLASGFEHNES